MSLYKQSTFVAYVLLPVMLGMCRAKSLEEFVDGLLNPEIYDRRVRPGVESGKPVVVYLDMFVNSISSVDEVKMEYVLSIFMRQRWIDDRLNFTEYDEDITLNYNMFDRLWVPDLYVKNEKKAIFHSITVPNRLLKLSPNGQIYYSQRLSLTLRCNMHLEYYPMDNQTCKIELESYGYTTKDIVFKWNEDKDPVQVSEWLEMPEFVLSDVSVGDCTTVYITGSFTCKYATFKLKRQFAYYLIQTFVPSCLIVALSWVSFWIDIHAVPARVTLGLLTVLTMTTQSSSISSRLPRVSYIKAIDVWMTCCLVFVFGALIEYSIVNVLARRCEIAARKKNTVRDVNEDDANADNAWAEEGDSEKTKGAEVRNMEPNEEDTKDNKEVKKRMSFGQEFILKIRKNPALGIDMISRAVFPSVFFIFNIAYWVTYKA